MAKPDRVLNTHADFQETISRVAASELSSRVQLSNVRWKLPAESAGAAGRGKSCLRCERHLSADWLACRPKPARIRGKTVFLRNCLSGYNARSGQYLYSQPRSHVYEGRR